MTTMMIVKIKKERKAGCLWLMQIILPIWEADIRRFAVSNQSRQKNVEEQISTEKKKRNLGMVVHVCHSRRNGKLKIEGSWSRLTWAKSKTLSPK
jgi:hypothetical protein